MRNAVLAALLLSVGCTVAEPGGDQPGAATSGLAAAPLAIGLPASASSAFAPPSLAGTASASSPTGSATSSATAAAASAEAVSLAPPPCPTDMVLVGRTCVDRYEAFLREVASDGSSKDHPHYERPVKGVTYAAANQEGAFPQGYISRVESKAACVAAGKRLCTKSEWTRACKNKGWMTYPYGQQGKRERCNTGKLHLLAHLFKNPPGGFKYEDHFNSPDLNKMAGWLAKGGEYTTCATDLGVHDMVGNLHEWVSDTVDDKLMERLAEEPVERRDQPWRVGNGVFMGGFYSTTSQHGPGCFFTTVAHEPTYHDYSTGFRCCKAADLPKPEPKGKKPSGIRPQATARTGSDADKTLRK